MWKVLYKSVCNNNITILHPFVEEEGGILTIQSIISSRWTWGRTPGLKSTFALQNCHPRRECCRGWSTEPGIPSPGFVSGVAIYVWTIKSPGSQEPDFQGCLSSKTSKGNQSSKVIVTGIFTPISSCSEWEMVLKCALDNIMPLKTWLFISLCSCFSVQQR